MKQRELIAGPWFAALTAWRALAGAAAPPGAFRILLLHDVPAARRSGLAALLDHVSRRCGFIAPREAMARLASDVPPANDRRPAPCLLTFDDGFASNREVAETLLQPRGIRAVFFVCPGLIDLAPDAQRAAIARNIHDGHPPHGASAHGSLMGWDDLAALARAGHAVGGHSLSHRRLTTVQGAALEDEIAGTAERLSRRLGIAPDWFAYPFGDIESIDGAALASVGRHWRVCRSGVRGLNAPRTHRLALLADHIDLYAGAAWQRLAVAGGLDRRYEAARRRLAAMAAAADHDATS